MFQTGYIWSPKLFQRLPLIQWLVACCEKKSMFRCWRTGHLTRWSAFSGPDLVRKNNVKIPRLSGDHIVDCKCATSNHSYARARARTHTQTHTHTHTHIYIYITFIHISLLVKWRKFVSSAVSLVPTDHKQRGQPHTFLPGAKEEHIRE